MATFETINEATKAINNCGELLYLNHKVNVVADTEALFESPLSQK